MNEKIFDLGTVLSITNARVFSNMNKVNELMLYLLNGSIDTIGLHQIAPILEVAQPYILGRYPQLNVVGKKVIIDNEEDKRKFLDEQKEIFGDSFTLSPMPKEMYQHIHQMSDEEEINMLR